jgi:hypothetical protein
MCCPPTLLDDRAKLLELAFRAEKGTELQKLHFSYHSFMTQIQIRERKKDQPASLSTS